MGDGGCPRKGSGLPGGGKGALGLEGVLLEAPEP